MMNKIIQYFSTGVIFFEQLGRGESILISNSSGKSWLIPQHSMKMGLALYQPSGVKGKLVKAFLPWGYPFSFVRKCLGMIKCDVALRANCTQLVQDIFNLRHYRLAVFSGTPGVHQKVTIQIFSDKRILGYLKCSSFDEVARLFLHEKIILDRLNETSLKGRIPSCLHCGILDDGVHVFVQSTVKTLKSLVLHQWTREHEAFLEDMARETCSTMPFETTELYESIHFLEGWFSIFSREDAEILRKAIKRVEDRWGGRDVSFSTYHGDFTPWNMFVEQGSLFVFDFEYAGQSYPPMLDRFHFLVQTGIFEKHHDVDEIYRDYLEIRKEKGGEDSVMDMDFLSYLLDIISRFVRRGKGEIEIDARRCVDIWVSLIAKL